MKKTSTAAIVSGLLLATTAGLAGFTTMGQGRAVEIESIASADSWTVDTVHSNVLFKIRHGGGATNFYGRFNDFSGEFSYDEDASAIESVKFEIKIDSVDTKADGRDTHLKSGDFFNSRQFPTASFVSSSISDNGDGTWKLTGNLTIVGETRQIEAELYDVRQGEFRGGPRIGFEAKFSIKRTDFGITTYVADDGGEDGPLGNTVQLLVAVEAAKGG